MTLIDSARSPLVCGLCEGEEACRLLPATGVETDLNAFVGNVPREPSGNDSVEISIDDTAVVGFDWAPLPLLPPP